MASSDKKRFSQVAPTIRDVAARAGVATATVSNVLTGRRQVAQDRRRRVLEAVDALGYQPNRLAAGLRRQRTGTVGMVVPDLTDRLANIRDRIEGYGRALAEAGLGERARVVLGGLTVEGCRAAIEQELRRADRPTAIFAATYDATLGAIKAIRAVDLAFPEDVSLLGFDDFDWMTVLRPYVSTI